MMDAAGKIFIYQEDALGREILISPIKQQAWVWPPSLCCSTPRPIFRQGLGTGSDVGG